MGIASDFVLIVMAGLVGGLAARILSLPLMVGYVAAGVLIGPHTAGPTVVQIHDIELLAEIGVALLLFSSGLELSFRDLQPVRRATLIGGPIQIVMTGGLAALAVARGFGMPAREAIWFGAMISVSSTAVVLKTLSAAGVTRTLASRLMIGLLVVQDLAVVPMLVVLPQLGAADHLIASVTRAIGIAAAMLGVIVILGTWLLPKLLRFVMTWGSSELFVVSVVAIGVGVGYATQLAGLSFVLGAFVAGLVLSESEFHHQALRDVGPVRDIFGLLFFVSLGMLLNPAYALTHAGQIVAVVLLTLMGKSLIIGLIARVFGFVNLAPWIVGLGLSQIGEFSFVLARSGLTSGALSKPSYDLALTSTVLTMALSPAGAKLALPLGRAWRRWRKLAETPAPARRVKIDKRGEDGTRMRIATRMAKGKIVMLVLCLAFQASAGSMSRVTQSPHRLNPTTASLHLRSTCWSAPHAARQGQVRRYRRMAWAAVPPRQGHPPLRAVGTVAAGNPAAPPVPTNCPRRGRSPPSDR